jgi:hypothetical protein
VTFVEKPSNTSRLTRRAFAEALAAQHYSESHEVGLRAIYARMIERELVHKYRADGSLRE